MFKSYRSVSYHAVIISGVAVSVAVLGFVVSVRTVRVIRLYIPFLAPFMALLTAFYMLGGTLYLNALKVAYMALITVSF